MTKQGGSYVVRSDGDLERVEHTVPSTAGVLVDAPLPEPPAIIAIDSPEHDGEDQ